MAPLWPQKEWFTDLLALLMAEPLELPRVWDLLVQPHVKKYHCLLETSSVELIQRIFRKEGFLRKVTCVAAADLRYSTAALYQTKWIKFLGWCDRWGFDPCKATIPVLAGFFLFLRQDLGLSDPAVKYVENSPKLESMPTLCRSATSPAETTISKWRVTATVRQLLQLPTGGTSAFGGLRAIASLRPPSNFRDALQFRRHQLPLYGNECL